MPEHKTCKQIDDFCNNYRDVNCMRVLIDFFLFHYVLSLSFVSEHVWTLSFIACYPTVCFDYSGTCMDVWQNVTLKRFPKLPPAS